MRTTVSLDTRVYQRLCIANLIDITIVLVDGLVLV